METQKNRLIQHGLQWGLILALVNIAIQAISYMINKQWLVSFWLGGISLVINIILLIIPVIKYRKELGGYIDFKNAFFVCLLVYLGSSLISTVFQYVLYNIIDPELSTYVKEKVLESTSSMMEKFGTPQEDMEKALADIEKQDFSQTPAKLGKQFLWGILFGGIISLIIAAILRKQPKIEDTIS
jgi:hypothetical protein